MKANLGLLVLLMIAASALAATPDAEMVFPTKSAAIDGSGFAADALVSIEVISERDGVVEYLIRDVNGDHKAYVLVDSASDPSDARQEPSLEQSGAKDFPAGDISFEDCEWGLEYSASRPSWASAPCPYGKALSGWECYWDSNSTENEHIRVFPNKIECRYKDNGSRAFARAYCCRLDVV